MAHISSKTNPLAGLVSVMGSAFRKAPPREQTEIHTSERDNIVTTRFALPRQYDGSLGTLVEGLSVEGLTYETVSAQASTDNRFSVIASVHVDCAYELYSLRNIIEQVGSKSNIVALEQAVFHNWERTSQTAADERLAQRPAASFREEFEKNGVCVVPWERGPLGEKEWFLIESSARRLPAERAAIDPSFTRAKVMRNGVIASSHVADLATVLKAPHIASFISEVTGASLRTIDAQVNVLNSGDYLSGHSHHFDMPFAVLHLNRPYEGGRYIEGPSAESAKGIDIPVRGLVISEGHRYHAVERVTEGQRMTVPLFFKHA